MELVEPMLGEAPETFDAIDVVWSQGEFVVAMIDSAVFVVPSRAFPLRKACTSSMEIRNNGVLPNAGR